MGRHDSKGDSGSRANKASQHEKLRLHQEADAILVVQGADAGKDFLVSSALLSAASDYVRTLLRSDFKEGVEARRGDCPTIVMGEDDPVAMQSVEGRLRIQTMSHKMDSRVCVRCGTRIKKMSCHHCYIATAVQDEYCTNQTRIADYFGVLGRSGLWPSLEPFKECTVSELAGRFARAKDEHQHRCEADTDCPLRRALEGLSHNACRIMKDIGGI